MTPEEIQRLRLKADVFKAMGSPVRLGIIELLGKGERCVCDIQEHVGTDISNVSKHLTVLKQAGVVTDRRAGMKVYYALSMSCAIDFTRCVEGVLLNQFNGRRAIMEHAEAAACEC